MSTNIARQGPWPDFSVALLNDYVSTILNQPWPGRNGSSMRSVYFTLCYNSYCASGFMVHASARDISKNSGVGLNTVSDAIQSLITDGWISRTSRRHTNASPSILADEFKLEHMIDFFQAHPPTGNLDSECTVMVQDENFAFFEYLEWQMHDVFRWSGLGKSCLEMYYYLSSHPNSSAIEIAKATGRSRTTVYRCYRHMSEDIIDIRTGEVHELVERENHKYRSINQNLSLVADILGVAGMSRKIRDKYRRQREKHRQWVTRTNQAQGRQTDPGFTRSFDIPN